MSIETGRALPAGRYGADNHTLTFPITSHAGAELFDYADRFMANDATAIDGILAFQDVHVRTADGRGGNAHQGLPRPDIGDGLFVQHDAAWFNEHGGMTAANGKLYRDGILSRGGTMDAHQMYLDFRGHEPSVEPLLEQRGLVPEKK